MKKKQNKKAGKVVRISDYAWSFLDKNSNGQSIISIVDGFVHDVIEQHDAASAIENSKTYYVLPDVDRLFSSAAEARGHAIVLAVRAGKGRAPSEPTEVRLIAS